MGNKKIYYPPSTFRICIDDISHDISGAVYSPLKEEKIEFKGIGELLVKVDRLFDKTGYPQSYQDKRSFDTNEIKGNDYRGVPKSVYDVEEIMTKSGKISTFDIMVRTRRNASWQGVIMDTGRTSSQAFNGDVELLKILSEMTEQAR